LASGGEAFLDYALCFEVPRYAQVLERGKDAEGSPPACSRPAMRPIPHADKLLRIIRGALRSGLTG
jgi:hypothetical protein